LRTSSYILTHTLTQMYIHTYIHTRHIRRTYTLTLDIHALDTIHIHSRRSTCVRARMRTYVHMHIRACVRPRTAGMSGAGPGARRPFAAPYFHGERPLGPAGLLIFGGFWEVATAGAAWPRRTAGVSLAGPGARRPFAENAITQIVR